MNKHRVCQCSCGCELKEDDGIFFDDAELCYYCDKGNRSDLDDELGRTLRKKEERERKLTQQSYPNESTK